MNWNMKNMSLSILMYTFTPQKESHLGDCNDPLPLNCHITLTSPHHQSPRTSHLPVVPSRVEALLGDDTGPDIVAMLAVPVELELLSSLHLLPVLREDQERVGRHRVQRHILCTQEVEYIAIIKKQIAYSLAFRSIQASVENLSQQQK